jgi:hypothetical protein
MMDASSILARSTEIGQVMCTCYYEHYYDDFWGFDRHRILVVDPDCHHYIELVMSRDD